MRKYVAPPAVSLLALALITCSTPPNANLEQVRSNFSALQSQPDTTKVTTLETKDAGDWLAKADKTYQDGEDQRDVDQLTYLTNQCIELAEQTIVLRSVEVQLQDASAQRAQARLDACTVQLDKLHNQLNAKQTSHGTTVTFGGILSDLGKPDLKPGAMRSIQQLAGFLQRNPKRQVIVEGYTDSTNSASYNQHLSKRRADSVRMVLLGHGIGPGRVATRGYGREYPVASNDTSSDHVMNRRVEVTISNDAKLATPCSSVSG